MIKKILMVDDEPNIVKAIKAILELNHYQVVTALDGEECLRKLMSEKPDLIILDVMMPKMTGYEVLIAMKQEWAILGEASKTPPVIILTGWIDEKVKELIEKEQIQAYLLKPIETKELLETIEKVSKKTNKGHF